MTAAADGHDVNAHRPSRPSRVRRATEKAPEDEAQLARMVRELHELEDEIASKLVAAERVLTQLASRRIHEDGGYTSWAGFEERMLATSPVLRAMRGVATPTHALLEETASAGKRDAVDARGRQTKALTAMARALERMRALDAELYRCAASAAGKLSTIELMRMYEECGYASFEEFLERALGPSPVLASAVALVEPAGGGADATPPAETRPVAERPEEPDLPPALFSEGGALLDAPPPPADGEETNAAQDARSGELEEPATTPVAIAVSGRQRRSHVAISIVLCVIAMIAGAAAGVGSELAAKGSGLVPVAGQSPGNPAAEPGRPVTH